MLTLAAVFPIAGIWSSTPLLHIDHAYHLYQVRTAILLWRDHALVGFDPSFAAGYLAGVTLNASAKVPALLAIALQPWLPPTVTYKAYVFASALLGPAAIMLAAVQLRLDSLACAALGMVTLLLWWASGFHWYHTAGMVSFVLACFLALPWSIAAQRALIADEFNTPRLLILGAFAAFGLLLLARPTSSSGRSRKGSLRLGDGFFRATDDGPPVSGEVIQDALVVGPPGVPFHDLTEELDSGNVATIENRLEQVFVQQLSWRE